MGNWDGQRDGKQLQEDGCWLPIGFYFPLFLLIFFFPSVLFNQNFKLDSKQLFINLSGEAGISLSGCY